MDAEVKRWEAKSCEELVSVLMDERVYEVVFECKHYQVEVCLLENTERYVHVCISVDDGSLPASFKPLRSSFIREKIMTG